MLSQNGRLGQCIILLSPEITKAPFPMSLNIQGLLRRLMRRDWTQLKLQPELYCSVTANMSSHTCGTLTKVSQDNDYEDVQ